MLAKTTSRPLSYTDSFDHRMSKVPYILMNIHYSIIMDKFILHNQILISSIIYKIYDIVDIEYFRTNNLDG